MSRHMVFFIEGRVISIERFEDETDPVFSERSSFILAFRNTNKYEQAKKLSFHHAQKMFRGVTYGQNIEVPLRELRELYLKLKEQ